jgi:glycosyltransferase involved in cell wall biosynthesis
MISIIISSADAEQLKQVTENITATIGAKFEIISVDNSAGQQGICTVYNKGIKQAKYDILCFMHEDVVIKTNNWGNILKNIFDEHTDLGLLGVVGGGYKPFTPSTWGGLGVNNTFSNMIQSYKYADKEPYHDFRNPLNAKLEKVACVDGVWLATTSKVASEFKFDEDTFRGFHIYDLDFSIAVGQKYKVAVTYEILLNHLSEGRYSREWMVDTLKLHEKWKAVLPVNAQNFTPEQCAYMEKITFKDFVKKLVQLKFPMHVANNMLRDNKIYREFHIFWKLNFYIFKTYLAGK